MRRSTPVGIYDNATPEGAFDLSGNAYTWTTSIYDQEQLSLSRIRPDDGREDLEDPSARRVVRGGSWFIDQDYARAVYRVRRPSLLGSRLRRRVSGVCVPLLVRCLLITVGAVREPQVRSASPLPLSPTGETGFVGENRGILMSTASAAGCSATQPGGCCAAASWNNNQNNARAVYRNNNHPNESQQQHRFSGGVVPLLCPLSKGGQWLAAANPTGLTIGAVSGSAGR